MPPNDSPYGTAPAPMPPSPQAPPAPTPTDPGPGQPASPPAPSNGGPAPSTPAFDSQALQQALQSALEPLQTQIASLREENASLRAGGGQPAPTPATSEDDFTQSLLSNPKEAVTSVVKEVVGQLAPFFNELSGTAHEAILEGHRNAIDTEFGTGTFQEEVMPILSKRIDTARRDNPALLASREWIQSEINGIKGFKMNSFVDRKAKAATARTEAEKAEAERLLSHFNATNLIGGIRGGGEKPREPTEAEQAYLASCAKGGTPLDLETLRKSQSSGTNLASLEEAFKQKEAS